MMSYTEVVVEYPLSDSVTEGSGSSPNAGEDSEQYDEEGRQDCDCEEVEEPVVVELEEDCDCDTVRKTLMSNTQHVHPVNTHLMREQTPAIRVETFPVSGMRVDFDLQGPPFVDMTPRECAPTFRYPAPRNTDWTILVCIS